MRALKVYGWLGFRRETGTQHGQTREICAAHSMAEVARIVGVRSASRLHNLCETGNRRELEVALAEPGVVFWKPLHDYTDNFQRS